MIVHCRLISVDNTGAVIHVLFKLIGKASPLCLQDKLVSSRLNVNLVWSTVFDSKSLIYEAK